MKTMKIAAVIFTLLILAPERGLRADLGDFKDYVEKAEAEKSAGEETSGGQAGGGFADFLFRIFTIFWYYNNTALDFGRCPYDGPGYIRRPWDECSPPEADGAEYGGKPWRYSADCGGLYLHGMGGGSWASFSGSFYKFIGPYADTFVISDGEDLLGGTRLGLQFFLVQTNVFNMALYGQWQQWYGVLYRTSGVAGLEFRLNPVKPLAFRAKTGFQLFDAFSLSEAELEGGFLIKAWEVFAGYRWWFLNSGAGDSSPFPRWQGPFIGLRRYF